MLYHSIQWIQLWLYTGLAERTALLHWKLNPNTSIVYHCCHWNTAVLWHKVCMFPPCCKAVCTPISKLSISPKAFFFATGSLSCSEWQLIIPEEAYLEQGQACFYSNNSQKCRWYANSTKESDNRKGVWMKKWMCVNVCLMIWKVSSCSPFILPKILQKKPQNCELV